MSAPTQGQPQLPLHACDASMLVQLLQRRELSAEALVRDCLEHIALRESAVQAWSYLNPEEALQEARALDRGAVRGLLHGLPFGIKDLFNTADMPTTYGSPIYAGQRPAADAACVAMARAAGAIALGKTVTTEFATFNPGKTHNPHRAGHTPGGSSSGSAAAVAATMVPLALGTQTAASIIRPAAFCGVVGFKPSYGSISRAGVKALAESLDTVGVFARSVADAALFAGVLAGDTRLHAAITAEPDSRALRIGVCHTFEWAQADVDTQTVIEQACAVLSRAGAQISQCDLPAALTPMAQIQTDIMAFEAHANLADERLRHGEQLSAALHLMLTAGAAISPARHHANLAAARQGHDLIETRFDDYDVLLAPSAIGVAPAGIDRTGDPVFGRMWTALGLPCIHLPLGSASNGLPIGVQLVGRFRHDAALIQIADQLHRQLQGTVSRH